MSGNINLGYFDTHKGLNFLKQAVKKLNEGQFTLYQQ